MTGTAGLPLLGARVFFGATLAFMGLNHFMNADNMIPYAESQSVPAPKLGVYASGGALVLGGVAILLGAYAGIGALVLAAFFLVVTPKMHDFWTAPEEQKQSEMTDFLKNTVMFGASLGFFALSTRPWAYAAGLGVF